MINGAPEVLLNIADRKTRRTLSPDLLTLTLVIPHSYCGRPSLSVPWTWCFHNVSAHTTFTVCETVEREVTDSIILGRWAYIHLPPWDGSVPGKSSRPRVPPLALSDQAVPYPCESFYVWYEKIHGTIHVLSTTMTNVGTS